ncbi:hypothetical protein ACN28S_56125 [Cystobacter fuscus]
MASQVGVERAYGALLAGADALSDGLRRLEVRDLRDRVAAVLVPAGLLGAAALVFTPGHGPLFSWGRGWGSRTRRWCSGCSSPRARPWRRCARPTTCTW